MKKIGPLLLAVCLAGCTSVTARTPPPPSSATPMPSGRTSTTVFAPPDRSRPTESVGPEVDLLLTAPQIVYAGDEITFTVAATVSATVTYPVAAATVDFGDGTSAASDPGCQHPESQVHFRHAYARPGLYAIALSAGESCSGVPSLESSGAVEVLSPGPPGSSGWPTCTTYQVRLLAGEVGFAAGNGVARVTARNVSGTPCQLDGYPNLTLMGPNRQSLPTHATDATTGAYLFAPIPPHLVGLPAGGAASFEIAFTDNPAGAGVNQPDSVACPAVSWVRVGFPKTDQFGTARLAFAPCGGLLGVSPFYPGDTEIGPNG